MQKIIVFVAFLFYVKEYIILGNLLSPFFSCLPKLFLKKLLSLTQTGMMHNYDSFVVIIILFFNFLFIL